MLGTGQQRVFILAMNAVPLVGVLWLGWSAVTVLILFWFETLANGTANVVRLYYHRKWTRKRGHFRPHGDESSKPLSEYSHGAGRPYLESVTSLFFPLISILGFFLGVLLAAVILNAPPESTAHQIDFRALTSAVGVITLLVLAELAIDLFDLANKPFAWIRRRVGRSQGRMLLMLVAILFGGGLLAELESPTPLLAVLVVFKALMELAVASAARPLPRYPPRFFEWAAYKGGKDPQKEWEQYKQENREWAEFDEQVEGGG